ERPDYIEGIRNRASARRDLGELGGVVADLTEALSTIPRGNAAGLYFDRGIARMLQADWAGAIVDFDQALEINPRFIEAYVYRGNARFHDHDLMAITDHLRGFAIDGPRAAREVLEVVGGDLRRNPRTFFQECNSHLASNPNDPGALIRRGLGYQL